MIGIDTSTEAVARRCLMLDTVMGDECIEELEALAARVDAGDTQC